MNTVPMITPNSITEIEGLENRPVFFLKLNGSPTPSLVVKAERAEHDDEDAKVSIVWGSKLMKNVQSSLVNMKIMTPPEMQEFQAAARRLLQNFPHQVAWAADTTLGVWIKIPYVDNLKNADYKVATNHNWNPQRKQMQFDYVTSSKKIKATIKRLSDGQAWYDLGKIVAVDLFNGNNDRFNEAGEWINRGNIMFLAAGPIRVIGLDTYDPTSSTRKLTQPGGFPALRALVDSHAAQQYAAACCRSVGEKLQQALTPAQRSNSAPTTITVSFVNAPGGLGTQNIPLQVALLHELFDGFAVEFEQGLRDGAIALKRYLQTKAQQYGYRPSRPGTLAPGAAPARPRHAPGVVALAPARPATATPQHKVMPVGVLDRMQYLGWI